MSVRRQNHGHILSSRDKVDRESCCYGRDMPEDHSSSRDHVRECVLDVATKASLRIDSISRRIGDVLLQEIAELRTDPGLVQLLQASIAGNVASLVYALRFGIDPDRHEVPAVAMEYARRLAQHRVSGDALTRVYRLGQTHFLRLVLEDVRASATHVQAVVPAIQRIMTVTADYIDLVCQQVLVAYSSERSQWSSRVNGSRAALVRELLGGSPTYLSPAEVSKDLNFPLEQRHVAVIVWLDEIEPGLDGPSYLERVVRTVTEQAMIGAEPLIIPQDDSMIWVWLHYDRKAGIEPLEDAFLSYVTKRDPRLRVALGTTATGVEGFHSSHVHARHTRAVMVLADNGKQVRTFSDPYVPVTALLCADPGGVREWIRFTLGALATNDSDSARLRETVSVFLAEGSSYKNAAARLNLHPNTIKYRVHKAEERSGGRITDRRLEAELALMLCRQLGDAALS